VIFWSAVSLVAGVAAFYWATRQLQKRSSLAIGAAGIFVAGFAASDALYALENNQGAPAPVSVVAPAPAIATSEPALATARDPGIAVIERLPRLSGAAAGSVDVFAIRKSPAAPLEAMNSARMPGTSILEVSGWICEKDYKPGTAVFAIVDGTRRIDLPHAYGVERHDVARAFSNPKLQNVGYLFDLPAGSFNRGRHELQIALVSADGAGFYTLAKTLFVNVADR
jgi:hypothetical protein